MEELLESIKHNDLVRLGQLLRNGAAVEAVGQSGFNAIHTAIRWNRPDAITMLIEMGNTNTNSEDPEENKPLEAAIVQTRPEVIKALVEAAGLDINKKLYDSTPLHRATELATNTEASIETIETIIGLGGDVNAVNFSNKTPLYLISATN